jgi:hypothetical protein
MSAEASAPPHLTDIFVKRIWLSPLRLQPELGIS